MDEFKRILLKISPKTARIISYGEFNATLKWDL